MNLLLLAAIVAATAEPGAPRPTAMVLPVRTASTAPPDVREAAEGIERTLIAALERHVAYRIVTRADVAATLDKAARDQLMGCDSESCTAEIADAMGADWLLVSELDVAPAKWSLQVALLERKSASALRRSAVTSRSLGVLMRSVDQLARQLAVGRAVDASDPELPKRLGTDAQAVKHLNERLGKAKDPDVIREWTSLVVEQNSESGALALATGALLALAGTAMFCGGVLQGGGVMMHYMDLNFGPQAASDEQGYVPLFPVVMNVAVFAFALLSVTAALGGAGLIAVLDAMNLGRISVKRDGCCRDEERIREAAKPDWRRRAAPIVGMLGAGLALLSPCALPCGMACSFPFLFCALTPLEGANGILLPSEPRVLTDASHSSNALVLPGLAVVVAGALAATLVSAGALGLYATDHSDLLEQ